MAGTIISGIHLTGIVLNTPATENPATIDATGTISNTGVALLGQTGQSWTVANFGTVKGTGIAGYGILLQAGGSVTNARSGAAGGQISGYSRGVEISGLPGTVVNFSTITGTGSVSIGVQLFAGGYVSNGTSGASSGSITARNTGVESFKGAGTIVNFGTVAGTGSIGVGVLMGAGGLVSNRASAAAAGLITGTEVGVEFFGPPGAVVNSGTIVGTLIEGIYFRLGGSVSNHAGGLITGSEVGVRVEGGRGSVANSGTVTAAGTGSYGVGLDEGGTVVNGRGGSAIGLIEGGIDGVVVDGAAGTITNFGTINGTGTSSDGIFLAAGGKITNGSSASTTALIKGAGYGVAVTGGTGMVANFGTIESTGSNSNGVGLAGGSVINFGTIEGTGSYANGVGLAGGKVTNGSGVVTTALIEGEKNGFGVAGSQMGGAVTVTNFGTIKGADAASDGVGLGAGGRVTNGSSGSTAALITGGNGVGIGRGTGKVTNFGTIEGVSGFGFVVAAADTAAVTLTNAGTIIGSGGTAVAFGAGNDVLTVEAGAVFKGAVSGGAGTNKLVEGAPGTLNVTGFSGFETIVLADGGLDTLTLKSANFAGVTKATITIEDGNMGNTVSAIGEAAADRIVVHAGAGLDALTGGPGNDVFYAGGDTTMIGGLGTNEFIFTAPGGNTIEDFAKSSTNRLVFSNSGFDLGLSGGSATPKRFTAAEAAALFTANPTGTFADTSQRLAYDTTSHELFSSSDGSGSTPHLVATLSDHAAISTSQLFYISGLSGSG